MSKGEPVLATAAGKVLKVFTDDAGGNRVYLDHGDGWVTHYLHLEQLPPLTKGQAVAQGEQIGRVGNTGTEQFHLHYTQMADGKAVRIAFNGSLINTHAGNKASWNTWGNGEKLDEPELPDELVHAVRPPGRQPLPARVQARHGCGRIDRLNAGGAGTTGVWSNTWSQGWTHLTPFAVAGKPHFFAYKSATGEVSFNSVNAGGLGATKIGGGTWTKGVTNFMPFSLGGQSYYIAYKSTNGVANLDRINAAGNGASNLWSGSWGKGWTHLMPFVQGGTQYFVAYKGGTGAVEIDKITGSGNNLSITEVWSGSWAKGYSHLVPITTTARSTWCATSPRTGLAAFSKIKAGGQGIQSLDTATWAKTGRRSRRSRSPARATSSPTRPEPARSASTS